MNLVALTIIVGAVLAGPDDTPPPARVAVVVVHATREARERTHFDPGLEPIRETVSDLNFDTYRKIAAKVLNASFEEETRFKLSKKYTLVLTPLSKARNGAVRMKVRIDMLPENLRKKPVAVISTTVVAKPGKHFRLGGLRYDGGELVIVMELK
ncbi:MAG: hypothetical protein GWP08_15490 [Nitrospiraceae bacterium]|nr:hypothetical protein [Nitrospiraceae bacterium]